MSINLPFRLFPLNDGRYPFGVASQSTPTLDEVLSHAERLPAEEKLMLEELLRKRRIEAWRSETAAEAKKAVADFHAGKLKPESAKQIITRLHRSK
jgi:hypothetical protein